MRNRSGVINHEEDLAKLTLGELDAEIERCKIRLKHAPNKYLQKSYASRIRWLEKFRDEKFG